MYKILSGQNKVLGYPCKSDTNFSPEDYPDAWEVV